MKVSNPNQPVLSAQTSDLEAAFDSMRQAVHRVRYGEQRVVEKHACVEALTIRDGATNQNIAKGVRFLVRPLPIDEPARPRKAKGHDLPIASEFQWSWMDPVADGTTTQVSRNVFVDLADIPAVIDGLGQLRSAAQRWEQDEGYATAEWMEVVFAVEDALVFGVIQRQGDQVAYLESRAVPRMYFPIAPSQLWSLTSWLRQKVGVLRGAP